MKPLPKRLFPLVFFSFFLLSPFVASAQVIDVDAFTTRGLLTSSVEQHALMLTVFIRFALGAFGFLLLCRAVWGLFLMATHGGRSDAEEKALATFKGGAAGLLIVAAATPLVGFLIGVILRAANGLTSVLV